MKKYILIIALICFGCVEVTHETPQLKVDTPKQIHYTQPETLHVKANDTLTINMTGYREIILEDLTRGSFMHLYNKDVGRMGLMKYPIDRDGIIIITRVY